jgi:maltodextrin utilization protein YvdJ
MSSTAIATVIKMMESLPEPVQDQVVDHLREYLQDLQDELQWDSLYEKKQSQVVAAARRAKREIAEGRAKPMVLDRQARRL